MCLTIQLFSLRIQFLFTKFMNGVQVSSVHNDDNEAIRTLPGSPSEAPAQVLKKRMRKTTG